MECNECGCDTDHEKEQEHLDIAKIMINDLQKQNDRLREEVKEAYEKGKAEGIAAVEKELFKDEENLFDIILDAGNDSLETKEKIEKYIKEAIAAARREVK